MKKVWTLLLSLVLLFTALFSYAPNFIYADEESGETVFETNEEITEESLTQEEEVPEEVILEQEEELPQETEESSENEGLLPAADVEEETEDKKPAPDDVKIVENETGDLIITCSDTTWLEYLKRGDEWGENWEHLATYGLVYLSLDNSYRVYSLSGSNIEFPFVLSEDHLQLMIPNNTLINYGVVCGDYTVRFSVMDYEDLILEEKLTISDGIKNPPQADTISVSCQDDVITISAQDSKWLENLAKYQLDLRYSDKDNIRADGGSISLSAENGDASAYLSNYRRVADDEIISERNEILYSDGVITIPKEVIYKNGIATDSYSIRFHAYGYESASVTADLTTSIKSDLPEYIEVTYDNGFIISSNDQEWLKGIAKTSSNPSVGITLTRISEEDPYEYSWPSYYFWNTNIYHLISYDGERVFLSENNLRNYNHMISGEYIVRIQSYGYAETYESENTFYFNNIEKAPELIDIYQNDAGDLLFEAENQNYLRALTAETQLDGEGEITDIGGRIILTDPNVVSGNATRSKKANSKGSFVNTSEEEKIIYDELNYTTFISADTMIANGLTSGTYVVWPMAFGYDSDEQWNISITLDLDHILHNVPKDLIIEEASNGDLIFTSSDSSWLKAVCDGVDEQASQIIFYQTDGTEAGTLVNGRNGNEFMLADDEGSFCVPLKMLQDEKIRNGNYKLDIHVEGYKDVKDYPLTITKGNTDDPYLVQSIEITAPSVVSGDARITGGKTLQLKAKVLPSTAKNKNVTWSFDEEKSKEWNEFIYDDGTFYKDIVSIDSTGKLTAKEFDYRFFVWVKATAKDGSGVSGDILVRAYPATDKVVINYEGEDYTGKTIYIDPDETPKLLLDGVMQHHAENGELTWDSGSVTWTSSDKKMATVDADGKVTIVGSKGTVKIIAKASDGTGKTASVTLNIKRMVKEVNITGPNEVAEGKTITLKGEVIPSNAATKTLSWESSDKTIATVASGKVTAKKGTAGSQVTIIARAKDGSDEYGRHVVSVLPAVSKVDVLYDGEIYTSKKLGVELGETDSLSLQATTYPEDASKNVTWSSSNKKLATVDEEGNVTILGKKGTVKITAKAADGTGKSAYVTLNINKLVRAIYIDGPDKVAAGKSVTLKALVEPADAASKAVTWSSSDTSVATVSAGKVTAKRVTEIKEVTITATAKDGSGIYDYKVLTVVPAVSKVHINYFGLDYTGKIIGFEAGESYTFDLTADTDPEDASNEVTWTSSNKKVATVDENGRVVVLGVKGKAKITAKAADGSAKTAYVTINVAKKLVDGIEVYNSKDPIGEDGSHYYVTSNARIASGKTTTLKVSVSPSTADNKAVTWTSSDTTVASVSSSGLVSGKKVETAQRVLIYAEAKDGSGVNDCYAVYVYPLVKSVILMDSEGNDLPSTAVIETPQIEGKQYHLSARMNPSDAIWYVTWKTSNSKIATVDDGGLVTFTGKKGSVKITATAKDGSGKSASVTFKHRDEMEEIEFWHTLTDSDEQMLQDIIDGFNAKYDGVYHVTQVSKPLDGFAADVYEAVENDVGPNLIWLYPGTAADYIENGKTLDFSKYLSDADYKNRVTQGIYKASTGYSDHGLHAIVLTVSGPIVFYNQDLLDKYHLEIPETWDELLAACETVVDGEKAEGKNITGFGPDSVDVLGILALRQNGLSYVNEQNRVTDWTNEKFIDWINWWKQAETEGYFCLKDPEGYHSGPFGNQQYLCYMGSSAGAAYISPNGFTYTCGPVPQIDGGTLYNEITARAIVGFKKNENADRGAALFAKYMTDIDNSIELVRKYSSISPFADAVENDTYQSYLNDRPQHKALQSMLSYSACRENVPGAGSIKEIFVAAIQSCIVDGADTFTEMQKAQDAANEFLQDY